MSCCAADTPTYTTSKQPTVSGDDDTALATHLACCLKAQNHFDEGGKNQESIKTIEPSFK